MLSQKDARWTARSRAPRPAAGTPQSRCWQCQCQCRWSPPAARCLLLICGVTASWQGPAPAAAPGPSAPQAVPGALQNRHNAGCKGQRAGRIAGSHPPAAPVEAAGQHEHVKAALSPPLRQVRLHNKFLELTSSRNARMKPSSRSPGRSSSPSPAHRLHVLRGDETSPFGQLKQQPQLQRCKSMERGPLSGHPPAMERVDRAPSPGWSCLPPQDPGPMCRRSHGQHRPCPSEDDTAGRWQPCPSNSSHDSSPWKVRGRSWLSMRSGTNISVSAHGNISSNVRLRIKVSPAGPQDILFGSG